MGEISTQFAFFSEKFTLLIAMMAMAMMAKIRMAMMAMMMIILTCAWACSTKMDACVSCSCGQPSTKQTSKQTTNKNQCVACV